jgi:hypothetical protein
MERDRREMWLEAARLFESIGTWMDNEDAQLDELQEIADELRALGIPRPWIGSAIIAARDHRLERLERLAEQGPDES